MKTKILVINPKRIDFTMIKTAAEEIKKGNLVVFLLRQSMDWGQMPSMRKRLRKYFKPKEDHLMIL